MEPINASSSQELLHTLAGIDINVPSRPKRKTNHCERWSICNFLASFADSEILAFPLRIIHRDRPDFLLKLDSIMVGIEVTEAVPENAAAVDAYRENKNIDGPFFLKRHLPGDAKLHGSDLRLEASSDESGDVWAGDSVEREWAYAMKTFIQAKVEKSKKPEFDLFERNWLLIYDNWPLPAVNHAVAAKKLFEALTPEECAPFENIFVECSTQFWCFSKDHYFFIPINDLWREK